MQQQDKGLQLKVLQHAENNQLVKHSTGQANVSHQIVLRKIPAEA